MTNPTPLSPAAQAVLDAYSNRAKRDLHGRWVESAIAAALRAAADQVVPLHICGTTATRAQTRLGMRHKLLAIADELESQ